VPTLALILASLLGTAALAADVNKAHSHQGVAEKFTAPSPSALSAAEKATLERGEAVRKQVKHSSGGRGIAIMDIQASPEKVWSVILDYGAYPSWIDNLKSTKTYAKGADHYKVEFNLNVAMMDVTYFIDHHHQPSKGYLTWQLDYSRESDIDDSTGYWLVYPTPGYDGWTRVEYTVDLRLKGWVPGIVENMLAKKGLLLATSWVKKQAE
jgi:hypothetical protein